MLPTTNRQVLLASRPAGAVTPDNFRLVEAPIPALADGEVLVKHHYLSVDPYMRARMDDAPSYAAPQPLDAVMIGGTVGEVIASRSPRFAVGDSVVGMGGWQEYAVTRADAAGFLRKVDTTHIPLPAYLGAVGMPGVTAWYGLLRIIQPRAGQTLVVSAASGAVGSVVGQLAKRRGLRVVGIAGGEEKCRWVVEQAGFDACIDYKAHRDLKSLAGALKAACPDGIDGNFENVGGMVLDAVMLRANAFVRMALCGMISGYDQGATPMAFPVLILTKRMTIEGFIISEHMEAWPEALAELGQLVATRQLTYRETIAHGLAAAPEAFIGMLKGRNFGKQLVQLQA